MADDSIPKQVKEFLGQFYRHFVDNNVYELHQDYENTFNELTNKYYTKTPWPDPMTEVAPLVDNDQVFLVLYSEVYYRHIYAKLEPSLKDRTNSYTNYCNLFNLILNHEGGPVTFDLPEKWLWDIVDEFVYQCNQFNLYRTKLIRANTSPDLSYLQQHPEIWSCYSVLNALYSLIGRSHIYEQLALGPNASPAKISEVAGPYGTLPLYKNLGYFSSVGLLRVHTLLGDFTLALKTMDDLDLGKNSFITTVSGAHFSAYYYVGFCYLMMHRFSDAIRTFSHILLEASRNKNKKSGQYDAVTKKSDQMYALLTILVGLCPTKLENLIQSNMRERFSDQLAKIQKGGEQSLKVIEELFMFGSPKFISTSLPNFEIPDLNVEAIYLHREVFMITVKNAIYNNMLKAYLSLYSSLELNKLLSFLQADDEEIQIKDLDELRQVLLSFKLTNTQIKWTSDDNDDSLTSESLLNGEPANVDEFDIVLNDNLIQIIEVKMTHMFSDWFLRNTSKNLGVQNAIRKGTVTENYKDSYRDKKDKKRKMKK